MAFKNWGYFALFPAAGFMLFVAGCQSHDKKAAEQAEAIKANDQVLESELRAFCPRVTLREGTAFLNNYEKGGDGDPAKLVYQASISDATRSCSRTASQLTMNIGVAGKVISGPVGKGGTITMPIRIVVLHGEDVLYSNLFKHQATVGAQASQWLFSQPNVTIPLPSDQNVQAFVGFDEGPPKKAE